MKIAKIVLLSAFLLVGVFSVGVGKAKADTVNLCVSLGDPVPVCFATMTVNIGKSTYNAGEQITVSGSGSAWTCSNFDAGLYINAKIDALSPTLSLWSGTVSSSGFGTATFNNILSPGTHYVIFNACSTQDALGGALGGTCAEIRIPFTVVAPPPPPPPPPPVTPTVTLTPSQTSVTAGTPVNLTWTSNNTANCRATASGTGPGNWTGVKTSNSTSIPDSHTETTGALNTAGDQTYNLTCDVAGAVASTQGTPIVFDYLTASNGQTSSNGQYTWTVPAGVTSVDVEAWGGGGIGGYGWWGGGGGGGGGGYGIITKTVIAGTQYKIIVGKGGVPTNAGGYDYYQEGVDAWQALYDNACPRDSYNGGSSSFGVVGLTPIITSTGGLRGKTGQDGMAHNPVCGESAFGEGGAGGTSNATIHTNGLNGQGAFDRGGGAGPNPGNGGSGGNGGAGGFHPVWNSLSWYEGTHGEVPGGGGSGGSYSGMGSDNPDILIVGGRGAPGRVKITYSTGGVATVPTVSATTTVTVTAVIPPAPTVTLRADPTSVLAGNTTTLKWTSTNSDTCTASGDWSGSKATTTGEQSEVTGALYPANTSKNYSLTCVGPGGTSTAVASPSVYVGTNVSPTMTASCILLTPKIWQASASNGDSPYTYTWNGVSGRDDKLILSSTPPSTYHPTLLVEDKNHHSPATQPTCPDSGGTIPLLTSVSLTGTPYFNGYNDVNKKSGVLYINKNQKFKIQWGLSNVSRCQLSADQSLVSGTLPSTALSSADIVKSSEDIRIGADTIFTLSGCQNSSGHSVSVVTLNVKVNKGGTVIEQ